MSNYHHEIGDEIAVSNTQTVRVVKALAESCVQPSASEYIVQTMDNKVEVYEVETISDSTPSNIGNRDIMVSDNASCWLWGSQDDQRTNRDHVQLLIDAGIPPSAWIDEVAGEHLKEYVRECVADCWPYWNSCLCDCCNDSDNISAPYEDELTAWYDAHNVDQGARRTMWDICYNGPSWHATGTIDRNPYDKWCLAHDIADYMSDGEVDCDEVAYDYMQDDFSAYDSEIRAAFREITGVDPEEVSK